MTVGASGTANEITALESAHNTPAIPILNQTALGVVVAGTLNGDVIILSPQALAIVWAGVFVHALVLRGLESVRKTLALSGARTVVLDYGIYRVR